jgi:glycosyltransferase involved in cell wall biosynthesis
MDSPKNLLTIPLTIPFFRNKYKIDCEFILNVANIEDRKNQTLLAAACKKLNKTLVLIGNIRSTKYLNEIKRVNSKVIVLDYIPHSDILISA